MRRIATVVLAVLLLSPSAVKSSETVSPQDSSTPPAAAASSKKLDINRATLAELVAVPGIGSRTAQAIIDLRSKKGSFARLDELLEVRGIKEKKLAVLSSHLTVVAAKPPVQSPATSTSK
jgi:competence protein ComEA